MSYVFVFLLLLPFGCVVRAPLVNSYVSVNGKPDV